MWLVRCRGWVSRRRYELVPVAGTSALSALGVAQEGIGAAIAYGVLTLGAGTGAFVAMRHKNEVITHVSAAGTIALADITTGAAAGMSWPTVTAWVLSTGAAYGVYGPWLVQQRNARLKLNIDTVKAKGALPQAMGLEAADPGLIGSSPEETALRRAIHALTGVTPRDVTAFTHTEDGGFVARVKMPAGRNTGPDAVIRKRGQFAANLQMNGELKLRKVASDELEVRLVTADALAETITYDDDEYTSIAHPIRLGFDEDGVPFELSLLYRHTLIAGATDWGKSGIVNLLIKRLVRRADVDIYGIDLKPGAVELGPWRPHLKELATSVEEARKMLDRLERKGEDRGAALSRLSGAELAAGREPIRKWVPGKHIDSDGDSNAIVVITDELAELVRQDALLRQQEAQERQLAMKANRGGDFVMDVPPLRQPIAITYESRLALDRFLAISYVSATQQPSRKVFGGSTDARGNYANRVSTRTGEQGHAQFIFGQGCQSRGWKPEELDLPGKFLAQTPEHPNSRVYRAEYVDDGAIAADVGHLHARAERLAEQARPAAVEVAPSLSLRKTVPKPPPLYYPDGATVGRDEWPDLYRVFLDLGSVTKDELKKAGHYSSRDTVRRALETWSSHGVQARQEGRATRYYLPDTETE